VVSKFVGFSHCALNKFSYSKLATHETSDEIPPSSSSPHQLKNIHISVYFCLHVSFIVSHLVPVVENYSGPNSHDLK